METLSNIRVVVLQTTLLFILILFPVSYTTRTGAVNGPSEAPSTTPSPKKKPSVGLAVGLTFFLAFIIVVVFVCICCNRRSSGTTTTTTTQGIGNRQDSPVRVNMERMQQAQARARKERKEINQHEEVERQDWNGGGREIKKHAHDEEIAGQQGNGGRGKGKEHAQDEEVTGQQGNEDGKEDIKRVQDKEVVGRHGKGDGKEGKKLAQDSNVKEGKQPVENSLGLPNKYSFSDLKTITNKFDPKNKIGGGGFGNVYKGTQSDGTIVAVKCLKFEGSIDDFKNEVEALSKADHLNLVRLIGYCTEGITKILVYEYMRNGSLDKWIFQAKPSRSLTWPEKKNIIKGIARGLVYLHEKCEKKILHRDLKPHNVLLDENKNAKLCDFGLAKLLEKDQNSTSTYFAGTPGYMASEVIKNKRLTDKIDVYSFGVVVIEVIFGKRLNKLISTDVHNKNIEVVILQELIRNFSDGMRRNDKEIEKLLQLAISCLREKPDERPTMLVIKADIQDIEAKFREVNVRKNSS